MSFKIATLTLLVVFTAEALAFTTHTVTVQAYTGRYIGRVSRGGEKLEAAKLVPDKHCKLTVYTNSDGTHSFKADNGKFFCRTYKNTIEANSSYIASSCKFHIKEIGPGLFAMRANNGKYLIHNRLSEDNNPIMATSSSSVLEARFVLAQMYTVGAQYNRV